MDEKIWERAKDLASRNYTIKVSKEETTEGKEIYLAKNPELYGCMAQGETIEEAITSLDKARLDYIYGLLEDGLDVPHPESMATQTTAVKPIVHITSSSFRITRKASFEEAEIVDEESEKVDEVQPSDLMYAGSLRT